MKIKLTYAAEHHNAYKHLIFSCIMVDKEVGKILKGEFQGTTTEIVLAIKEFNGRVGVDIREYAQSEQYTGPTKKGLRIPADKFEEFKTMINSIDPNDLAAAPVVEAPVDQAALPAEAGNEDDAGVAEDGTI